MLYWLLTQLANYILGEQIIERVVAAVGRWAEKKFKEGTPDSDANSLRRHGVLDEIKAWGEDPKDPCPSLSESFRRLALELGFRLFKIGQEQTK
jgi:hypothetical protein